MALAGGLVAQIAVRYAMAGVVSCAKASSLLAVAATVGRRGTATTWGVPTYLSCLSLEVLCASTIASSSAKNERSSRQARPMAGVYTEMV